MEIPFGARCSFGRPSDLDTPTDRCLHQLFEARAETTPDAVALMARDEQLSYRELDRRASQLACHLRSLGVSPETLVGLHAERSCELVVGMLGILKAGGGYVPLDPAYPRERLAFMREDAGIGILLTQEELRAARAAEPTPVAGPMPAPENLAYVLYTSGSTGRPKGVAITHRSAAALVHWTAEVFSREELSGVLASTSICFDLAVFELFATLSRGGTVILARDALELPHLPAAGAVTLINTVPSAIAELLDNGGLPAFVRTVNLAGEPLARELVDRLYARETVRAVYNLYGPTEDTTYSTWARIARDDHGTPIGRPIAGTRAYLLDRRMQPAAMGEAGELYLGGAGTARGYLNRPQWTAERFVPDPFSETAPGSRLYKTGDLVRSRPDGHLEFLGRLDHQVKIRGFRIEPGEIEAVLRAHPAIRETVVIGREDRPGERRLVAYVVPGPGRMPSVPELRRHLGEVLPAHMMPAAFVALETLPRLPNGKVDRAALGHRALPAADGTRPDLGTALLAPHTPREKLVAGIWAELLGLDEVGLSDNVFDLGAHSLIATRFASRLREFLGVDLPLGRLFDAPTVAGQLRVLDEIRDGQSETPVLGPVAREGDLPLSFSQERVWFLQHLDPANRAYHFQASVRFRGRLSVPALARTLTEIVRRHEIFRTTFPAVDGRPVEVVYDPWRPKLAVVDFVGLPADTREAEAQRELRTMIARPFRLDRLPLIRWTLLRLRDREHLLVHVEHHLIHDGWSYNVFLNELFEIYGAFSTGKPSPLADPEIQFADFACFERRWIEGPEAAAQLAYWTEKLASSPPVLAVPTDRPRPLCPSFRGDAPRATLSAELYTALRRQSRRLGVTLFMTMLAVFAVLLRRLTRQDDVNVGCAIANRRWRAVEKLIGMLVNNVVLRTAPGGNPTFVAFLDQIRRITLEAHAHQDLPFEKVVQSLRSRRDLSHNPLFQVMFGFHDSPLAPPDLPGLSIENVVAISNRSAKFDLNIIAIPHAEQRIGFASGPTSEGVTLVWEYASDLFDPSTITRMIGHYRSLLNAVLEDPHRRLSELPLLARAQRHQLVVEWNDHRQAFPEHRCLHQLFEDEVEDRPEAVAVVCGRQHLSYAALNRSANQLAHHLRRFGVGPETRVGIGFERSPELVIALLGILKAGGAYVPFDPSYPRERLRVMEEDSGAAMLLTRESLVDHFDAGCAENPATRVRSENPAYVLYTSGSTGRPKGVVIAHRAICNHMLWMQTAFPLSPADRVLQKTPVSFDASVWEFWAPLLAGARLVLARPGAERDPTLVAEILRDERVTILQVVPSLLRLLVKERRFAECRDLRRVFCGGEPLVRELSERFFATGLTADLLNLYGPTEATIDASIARGRREGPRPTVPIGRPIANARIHVLDDHLWPVPIGVIGTVHIGGAGLARGYLGRPGLTAGRFIPDPLGGSQFSAGSPEAWPKTDHRLYNTGDLARVLPDGELEFLGRADHQVKIRGFRIELGEIEAVLAEHPGVLEAVAVVREETPGDQRLVAYVVPGDGDLEASRLRRYLREKLPESMVPSTLVTLEALPRSPGGKIDRGALPASEPQRSDAAFVAPRSPGEEMVAGIWSQVLGLREVGSHDHFFELGGHSLLATQVLSRVRSTFGVELPVRTLFEQSTVAELTATIEAALRSPEDRRPQVPPLVGVARDREIPLSFAQQGLWFLGQLEGGSPAYNMAAAYHLEGPLHREALEQTLREIVRHHEILRTTFPNVAGRPVQAVAPEVDLGLPVVDLAALPPHRRRSTAEEITREATARPFDVARGPLFVVTLLRLAEQRHVVLFNLHHIISDGWSQGVLFDELAVLYASFLDGKPSPIAALPIQYADFAVWQRRWLRDETLKTLLAYWKKALAGFPLLELPTDRPRPPLQTDRGATRQLLLSADQTRAIRALSLREGSSVYMTLLAAFMAVLGRTAGQQDVVVGSPIANRGAREIEGLIGFFVNTLVLRGDLRGDPSFRDLLRRVRETALGAYAHQDLPFERLVDALQPERDLSRSPLFQVLFTFQNTAQRPLSLSRLTVRPMAIKRRTAQFDLSLTLWDGGEVLPGSLELNTDLFDETTIARLEVRFTNLLAGAVAEPGRRLSELAVLSRAERQQILVEWNDTALGEKGARSFLPLFADQVRRSPDAPAVVDPGAGEVLTYREINRRSNRLAHYLRGRGVFPEVRVGLLMERTPEMVVAILGILKAGGAYLPLDPSYPRHRLEIMLADAGAALVLTHERCRIPPPEVPLVRPDRERYAIARRSSADPTCASPPQSAAYVIYTSGSTGQPKGVVVEHRSLAWYCTACTGHYALGPGDRILQLASIGFDISVGEIFPCLAAGAALVLRDDAMVASMAEFLRRCREYSVTVLLPPTAFWHELAAAVEDEGVVLPPSLRLVSFGGERVLGKRIAGWRRRVGRRVRLCNGYGPTEATVESTLQVLIDDDDARTIRESAIGRPVAEVRVWVLDPQLREVPFGSVGELCVAGPGLARGYFHHPAATAEKFVPNPWPRRTGERLYRTGDRVRFLADGNLEFLGRIDHQIKIRGYRVEPEEIAAALKEHISVREAVVLAREDVVAGNGDRRLVAYVVASAGAAVSASELRDRLRKKLPDYMVPSAVVLLEALPLTPNGKLDRQALPPSESWTSELAGDTTAPRSPVQEVLARIWARVLRIRRVGIHDNFFALGGDSILSIRIIAEANREGLGLTPKDLFQRQTVAELAEMVGWGLAPPFDEDGGARPHPTGSVPLTPIQRWFFEQELPEPWHFNQAMLVTVDRRPDFHLLRQAVGHLQRHHDALRLRFAREAGRWRQFHGDPGDEPPVIWLDLSLLTADAVPGAIERAAAELQASLDLTGGPLVRVAYFDPGRAGTGRLLFVIHHLAVDGVSWSILLEDLAGACRQLEEGRAIIPPAKTTSYQEWADRLEEYARSEEIGRELDDWLAASRPDRLPVDFVGGRNTSASVSTVDVGLGREETRLLLREVPAAYRTRIDEVLLTALARCYYRWTGRRSLLVDLEGHGREEIFAGMDLSRTVGWFTSSFPVVLEVREEAEPGEALKAVKETLRTIPRRGIGYGLLRYLKPESAEKLSSLPGPEVSFNYLGQFEPWISVADGRFGPADESKGPSRSRRGRRSHLLEIDGGIAGGRLGMTWRYSRNLHRRSTIETLAQGFADEIRALIIHCLSPRAGSYTPSDFPLARLDQEAVNRLTAGDRGIEDVYPLSSTQQAMLFRTLTEPESAVYFEQSSWTLTGALDLPAFRRAWERVVERHPVLRTAFAWERLERPLQIVHRQIAIPWTVYDWRRLGAGEQETRLATLLEDDRRRGFELRRAPLMRLALLRLGDERYRILWSVHHLLLDGWSTPLVLDEVFTFYDAFRRGDELERRRPRPYRDYIAWLEAQDPAAAETFWRRTLAGFTRPTPLVLERPRNASADGATRQDELRRWLPARATAALDGFARRQRLTINTLMQAAWALLLSRTSGEDDVVFGATVAGRPASLAGSESMVGLFINALPVRVRMAPDDALLPWLRRLQEQQAEARQYEASSLATVERQRGLPCPQALFASNLIFQNYPILDPFRRVNDHLEIGNFLGFSEFHHSLTLTAAPGRELSLRVSYETSRFDRVSIARLLGHLRVLLEGMVTATSHLAALPILTAAERHQLLIEWSTTRVPQPETSCIHHLFAGQVARTPDAVAVVFANRALSYRELNRRANRLAHYLRAQGVGPETVVGLGVKRSPEMVVGLLAVLKAGGAYLPLDPTYPKERLTWMVNDSAARVVLTQEWLRDRIIGRHSAADPAGDVGPENPAYVIYTSGSTGRPKGVVVTHRALAHHTVIAGLDYDVGPGDRILQFASISFDASAEEIYPALTSGATLVLRDDAMADSVPRFLRGVAGYAISVLDLPTAYWHELCTALDDEELMLPASVRLVILGGEKALADRLVRWRRRVDRRVRLVNTYGPTEATIVATRCELTSSEVPIGRPLAGVRAFLLDRLMRPVPMGVPGELHLGGVGLARGYLRRPQRTAERFIPSPFGIGERLYKTGDLARFLPDGYLTFLGRIDDQVKIRGVRVEPGEVEVALADHPAVGEAVVVAREDVPGDRRLVAYLVARPALDRAELVRWLREKLPAYMMPSAFVVPEVLPRLPGGKVDRRALPAPDGARAPEDAFVAPRNAVEKTLAEIFSEVLSVDRVGLKDDFFTLGGHSLLAVRLLGSIERLLEVRLPLTVLFREPTLQGLAGVIGEHRKSGAYSDGCGEAKRA